MPLFPASAFGLGGAWFRSWKRRGTFQEDLDISHESLNRAPSVVPSDVVVKLFPQMLDQVVFRRVRRQEMTLEYPAESAQGDLSLPARVDDVVVEDEVDPFGLRIDFAQFLEQLDEELAVLPRCSDVDDLSGLRVQGASHVLFLVDSGSDHYLLRSWKHPVTTDLGVQVYVDLIDVDGDLGARKIFDQTLNSAYPPRFPGFGDGRLDDGPWTTPARVQGSQHASNCSAGDDDPGLLCQHQSEELLRPGRTDVAEVLWKVAQDLDQPFQEVGIHLGTAVALCVGPREPLPRS